MDKIIWFVWCVGLTQECDSPNPDCGSSGDERMVDGKFLLRLVEVVDV